MENRNLLEARLKEKELTPEQLSKKIGLSYTSLNQRLNGRTDFKLGEIKKIRQVLELSIDQMVEIFF